MIRPESDWRVLPDQAVPSLSEYLELGGGVALERTRHATADQVIDQLTRAGLRGRGGAGFPTGAKWRSILTGGGQHHYAVCNGAEGEPGSFKDRALIRANPYQILEGLIIAARTVGAIEAFLAVKASFWPEIQRLSTALTEIEQAGWLDGLEVKVSAGPEEYLFGEEKALLEVIEGNDPLPRWLPPYLHGLFATTPQLGWQAHDSESGHYGEHASNPTLVNNAETLAQATWILSHDTDEFRSVGTEQSPGTVVCTVVGDVERPGVIEVPMGTPLHEVLARCGGPRPGRTIKAVVPGVANAILPAEAMSTPLTYEDMVAAGSGLGAAGFIVYDDTACMVEVTATLSRFLSVESCGQCLPCKLGTGHITAALERLCDGTGAAADLDIIKERLRIVADGNRCYLPVQEQNLVSSLLRLYPEDLATHLEGRCASLRARIPTPKIADLVDGVVTYDERQEHKQPDWSYR
ncbi:MAG: SLBB domain-containing protein [Acidimicrobiia bacterium]|nr:SLBB domain-containing protein [Acidimicrobiia bacterium]